MRKASIVMWASLVLLIGSLPALAQSNQIVLSGSGNATPISFHGTGSGNFHIVFNLNNLSAFGDGVFATAFANQGITQGFYSILNAGAIVSNIGAGSCGGGSCTFMLSSTGPLSFSLGSSSGANDLLQGNLSLVDITQTGTNGVFNDQLLINLVVTGGSLQSMFAANQGQVQLTIKFTSSESLQNIQKNQALLAKVVSGGVFPVPEPGSLTLLGAGLIGLAGVFRKKKIALR